MQSKGFTLIEVLVALALLCVAALGGVQLVATATRMMGNARVLSTAAAIASVRMEQLRALRFEFDAAGLRQTDVTTDLSRDPPAPGGPGMTPAGSGTLDTNTPGYVDFVDANGLSLGGGTAAPRGAVFLRRWSVEATGAGSDLVVLQVMVRPLSSGMPGPGARAAGELRLLTMRARTMR